MTREEKLKEADAIFKRMLLDYEISPSPPGGPTADVYRIANYQDGVVGVTGCEALLPHFDSGLRWGDASNPRPDVACFNGGVAGGVTWDGTFYRDTARYPAGGNLFWSAYLKPGSVAGMKGGYWLNFGSGWCHLQNDNPSQMLNGACPRLLFDATSKRWKLIIEATKFVTLEIVEVWTGIKIGGNDPTGVYTRISGLDTVMSLKIEEG